MAAAFVAAAATSTAAFARTLLLQLCADRGPRGRALLFASCVLVARMTYAACGSAACLLTDGTACDSRSAEYVCKRSEVRLGQISEVGTQINLFFRRKNSEKLTKQVSAPKKFRLVPARKVVFPILALIALLIRSISPQFRASALTALLDPTALCNALSASVRHRNYRVLKVHCV